MLSFWHFKFDFAILLVAFVNFESCSISEIRLDPYLAVDTSNCSQYGSRGASALTPPASNEGSTPTWTEGTPSFTESSSSCDIGNLGEKSLYLHFLHGLHET